MDIMGRQKKSRDMERYVGVCVLMVYMVSAQDDYSV